MLRVATYKNNHLTDVEANLTLAVHEQENGKTQTKFYPLKLQFAKVNSLPISWTMVHPIDEESALYGRSAEEIKKMDLEVYVLLKGFDDVFSQTIYSRNSYLVNQFVYGAKFRKPWHINSGGKVVMDLTKIGEYDVVPIPVPEMV